VRSEQAFGLSALVLSGFVRIVTSRSIFKSPTPLDDALLFTRILRQQPHAVPVTPGARHWEIFTRLCRDAGAKGNLVADAYLAAMAIESGCEWITTDGDFARFPGLKWRRPF
jgi:toxin-antitoxin system PIN domain toxin